MLIAVSPTTLSIVSAAISLGSLVLIAVALVLIVVAARRRSEALLADAEKVRDRALELVAQAHDLAEEFAR